MFNKLRHISGSVEKKGRVFSSLSPDKDSETRETKLQKPGSPEASCTAMENILDSKIEKLSKSIDTVNGQLQLLDTINSKVSAIETTLNTVHTSINEALQVAEDAKKMALEAQVAVTNMREEILQLRQENKKLENKVTNLECQSRRSNLNIDNVPESPGETPTDTLRIFQNIMANTLKIQTWKDIKIERCHRRPGPKSRPRPIIVKFNWYPDRELVWAHRKNLKGSNVWLREDFPEVIEERRRRLLPIVRAARRDSRYTAHLQVDQLVVNGQRYNIDQVQSLPDGLRPEQVATRKVHDVTLFYRKESALSNFHPCKFTVDGETFNCSEQYYQAKKCEYFNDDEKRSKVMSTDIPYQQWNIGRHIKNYDEKAWYAGPAIKVMETCALAKFSQNEQLRQVLLDTGKTTLAEASPKDTFWGIGMGLYHPQAPEQSRWTGQNKLGNVLMTVREQLAVV